MIDGGVVQVLGYCFGCKSLFGFNPHRVPSYEGEPICKACITLVNERRKAAGRPLWPVFEDSYDPIPAAEL